METGLDSGRERGEEGLVFFGSGWDMRKF